MLEMIGWNAAVLAGLAVVLWLVSLVLRDASIVDPCWGPGFALVAWLSLWQKQPVGVLGWLLVVLVSLWGMRLGLFLAWRNFGKGEDRRYTAMRDKHGRRFAWVSLFTVFLLQAVLLWIIAMPIQSGIFRASEQPGSLSAIQVWTAGAGLLVWGLGFAFESVGDWQMARFRADPANRGQVMDRGLWGWTRHPNYFGDFCVWWGYYLVATAAGSAWTVFSPLLMSWLLLRVSGVTLLEKDIGQRRPGYADYVRRTSSFFPWPPGK